MTYVQPHFSCSVCILQKNDCHLLKLCCIQSNETVHIVCLLYIFILFLLCAKQKLDNNFECVNVLNLFCPFYILSYPSKYCDTDHSPCRSILWCWNVHVCVHCISLMSKIKTIKQIIHFSSRHCYFLAHLSTKCSSELLWSFNVRRSSSVRPSVRACVRQHFFKQHLLWNRLLDFDQTSQEWSLGGPLSKLFKPFQLVA